MACQLLEIEVILEKEYNEFITTEEGIEWINMCKTIWNSEGDFGDYLHTFYPEFLM